MRLLLVDFGGGRARGKVWGGIWVGDVEWVVSVGLNWRWISFDLAGGKGLGIWVSEG